MIAPFLLALALASPQEPQEPQPIPRPVLVHNEALAGVEILSPRSHVAFWGQQQQTQYLVPQGPGDVLEVSWKHEEADGTISPIAVRAERRPGESIPHWVDRFKHDVQTQLALYPPNTADALGIAFDYPGLVFHDQGPTLKGPLGYGGPRIPIGPAASDDSMSASWKHDPDDAGPLKPITVTATTTKRPGETSSVAANRLKDMVRELKKVFPPNAG